MYWWEVSKQQDDDDDNGRSDDDEHKFHYLVDSIMPDADDPELDLIENNGEATFFVLDDDDDIDEDDIDEDDITFFL